MKIEIRPKEGLTIVHPKTLRDIPAEGMKVDHDTYWVRRLQKGDVVLVENEEKNLEPAIEEAATKNKPKTGGKK